MGSPVVIDDGGSTRIKQIKNRVRMDDLMGKDVGGVDVFQDKAAEPFGTPPNFLCLMKVRYHDWDDAEHHIEPTGGLRLEKTDVVTITSKNGQLTTITFDPVTHFLIITLTATGGAAPPIVDAKKDGKLHRYVVTNAGPIQTVEVARGGITTTYFTNVMTTSADPKSMYTMVFFRAE